MKKLQIIEQREILGNQLTIYGTMDNPLFLAKDVANWINHTNHRVMLMNVDEDEKGVNIVYTLGGEQKQWFLTENGLYEVLMLSKKPIAKQFKKEVKNILRQIRKTGGYIPIKEEDTEQEILAKALFIMQKTLKQKELLLEEQKTKVETYDRFIDKKHTLGFRELRKELESTLQKKINERILRQVLKGMGIIGKTNKATAKGIREGFAVTKDIETSNGPKTQDRFTMKTRDLLIEEFR